MHIDKIKKLPDNNFLSLTYDPKLFKTDKKSRLFHFVLLPYAPAIPRSNDSREDTDTLVAMGLSTIKTLRNTYKPTNVCSSIIFPISTDVTEAAYDRNRLGNYTDIISAEKQHPIHFHIAAHGDPTSIGGILDEKRVSPKQFAANIHEMLIASNLLAMQQTPLVFVFHACNSAWAPINKEMAVDDIKRTILAYSFIGVFANELSQLGYKKINVIGYRGFYSHTTSHKGSIVSRSSAIDRNTCDGRPACATEINILMESGAAPVVLLPRSSNDLFFPVNLDDLAISKVVATNCRDIHLPSAEIETIYPSFFATAVPATAAEADNTKNRMRQNPL